MPAMHYERAQDGIQDAANLFSEGGPSDRAQGDRVLAAAQVQATLALVDAVRALTRVVNAK